MRTYNRNTYENEKRNALNAWANHIKIINATPLRKGEPRKPRR